MEGYQEVCGAMHLHSPYSDGNSTYASYAEVAAELGLEFLGMTDHMNLGARKLEKTIQKGVIFLIGYEHNDEKNHNHCLVFHTKQVAKGRSPQEYLADIEAMGGYVILAHPEETRHYFQQFPPLPWTSWEDYRFQAIEIWNQFSIWVENLKSPMSVINLFFPRRLVKHVSRSLIQRWDALNCERFVAGIGGVDAHCLLQRVFLWEKELFPLKVELKGIRQHFYLPTTATLTPQKKEELIKIALLLGAGFTSNYRRGDARGTEIYYQHASGILQPPGIAPAHSVITGELVVHLPLTGHITIIRNGVKIAHYRHSLSCRHAITAPGSYRVEVSRQGYGWIYSNHIPLGQYPFHD